MPLLPTPELRAKFHELDARYKSIDLENDAGDYDRSKVDACTAFDTEGQEPLDAQAKVAAHLALIDERNKAYDEWQEGIKSDEKRNAAKRVSSTDEPRELVTPGQKQVATAATVHEAVRQAAEGKSYRDEIVRGKYHIPTGRGGLKTAFSVGTQAVQPDGAWPIYDSGMAVLELLDRFNTIAIPQGQSSLSGLNVGRGGTAHMHGRSSDAITESSNTGAPATFPVQGIVADQDVPMVLAGDHTMYVSTVGEVLVDEVAHLLLTQALNGNGSDPNLHGAFGQMLKFHGNATGEVAASGSTTGIIEYLEGLVMDMRAQGVRPDTIILDIAAAKILRNSFRKQNYMQPGSFGPQTALGAIGFIMEDVPVYAHSSVPPNTGAAGNFRGRAILGIRGPMDWSSDPNIHSDSDDVYVKARMECAVALWNAANTDKAAFRKFTHTDRFAVDA